MAISDYQSTTPQCMSCFIANNAKGQETHDDNLVLIVVKVPCRGFLQTLGNALRATAYAVHLRRQHIYIKMSDRINWCIKNIYLKV